MFNDIMQLTSKGNRGAESKGDASVAGCFGWVFGEIQSSLYVSPLSLKDQTQTYLYRYLSETTAQ